MQNARMMPKLSILAVIALLGLLFLPVQPARGATGCTCPTGCETPTVITAPFSYSGVGEFCWQSTELGSYIQSWGADSVQVTGVDYTNMYVVTDQMLRDTTGTYYVYYRSTTVNGNFSAVGNSGITGCHKAWCSTAQYSSMNFGAFTMFNNIWGATSGQMIQANGPSDWNVTSNFPETGGVKSYPNASLDLNGHTLSTLGTCTSSFNVTVPSSGSWESAYDLWVPSEVMIWVNKHGLVGPIAQGWNDDGTPIPSATNVSVGGSTWDVYHGGSNVVSFVRQGDVNSGTVDIAAILNWIADQGWISRTSNLGKFQFGFEITSAPGGLTFTLNNYSLSCGGVVGPTSTPSRTPTRTFTRTNTPTGATSTPTRTSTRSSTPSATATRTNTPTGATATPSRTSTRTATRSNTPTGATATPTRTATRSSTPTATGGTVTPCSPVNATIAAPYNFDGAGTFCWQASNLGAYINSWNLANLTINGVNYTNLYVFTSNLPPKINGYWYISYTGNYSWSHFEAK